MVTGTGTYFSETCHPWKLLWLWLWLPVINKYMAQYEHVKPVMAVPYCAKVEVAELHNGIR